MPTQWMGYEATGILDTAGLPCRLNGDFFREVETTESGLPAETRGCRSLLVNDPRGTVTPNSGSGGRPKRLRQRQPHLAGVFHRIGDRAVISGSMRGELLVGLHEKGSILRSGLGPGLVF